MSKVFVGRIKLKIKYLNSCAWSGIVINSQSRPIEIMPPECKVNELV